jgi:hypothetical protein
MRLPGRAGTLNQPAPDMTRLSSLISLVPLFAGLAAPGLYAQAPATMSYQSFLTDAAGAPVTNADADFRFFLYDAASGGTEIWTEDHLGVSVVEGVFAVHLGAVTPLSGLNLNQSLWLQVFYEGTALAPRTPISGSPYTLGLRLPLATASAGGEGADAFRINETGEGNAIVGSASGAGAAIRGVATGSGSAGDFSISNVASTSSAVVGSTNGSGNAVYGVGFGNGNGALGSATGSGVGLVGRNTGNGRAGLFEIDNAGSFSQALFATTNGFGRAIHATQNGPGGTALFIETLTSANPDATLWARQSGTGEAGIFQILNSDNTDDALRGVSNGTGDAVTGRMTGDGIAGSFEIVNTGSASPALHATTNGSGDAVQGEAATRGVYGVANAPSGVNYGVYGESNSVDGIGVYGVATQVFSTIGTSYGVYGVHQGFDHGSGVYGETESERVGSYAIQGNHLNGGVAIIGESNGSGESISVGVAGSSGRAGGTGVRGMASAQSGVNYGVYGSTNSDDGYGVYGTATIGGVAGFFDGAVHVDGFLTKNAGAFRIDHPLDPQNRYLYHSFVESPDMLNVYNGTVVLDAEGEAIVELPSYFEALNRDFRYQLTCIGAFAPVYIAVEVQNNSFRIAGGTPGLRVSWQVTGIRHDAYAEQYRMEVEVDKAPEERGTYLHPEAHGQTLLQPGSEN